MKKIVLFASGNGTNAENIMNYFNHSAEVKVVGVFSNNEQANVIERAKKFSVPCFVFSKTALQNDDVLNELKKTDPDLIILAGFLLKFPSHIIDQFPNKVINIHPALLPNYGGKGMYGMHVHQAVLANKEKETGITIHYVNEHFDEGEFIFQSQANIENCTYAEEIAQKVHELEMKHFPSIIEDLLRKNNFSNR
ncbi:phosphoribosylglycinamide formyltransferase [Flavobacterium sp. 20NA77.7]|uniref:phosphoribosylglycinamide formyltransferase 1 n=1 Tax=Flavobacterium nakdongensis TaxID=3073563 RepID=A0ABY9RCB1_9FLAO|nr:phosphoribosylglycinamide formyltransferase [Flavobacterium sp. 20NA77.7]WMW77935.1 phosphoribosylglycinamide formyltransferase [Flavobacterium sp. 20NA77.7]